MKSFLLGFLTQLIRCEKKKQMLFINKNTSEFRVPLGIMYTKFLSLKENAWLLRLPCHCSSCYVVHRFLSRIPMHLNITNVSTSIVMGTQITKLSLLPILINTAIIPQSLSFSYDDGSHFQYWFTRSECLFSIKFCQMKNTLYF